MQGKSRDASTCGFDNLSNTIKCPVMSTRGKKYGPDDVHLRQVGTKAEVGIGRDPDPAKATEDAINKLGGMCKFVKKGDLVGIKLNITGGVSTNPASYTSPDVAKKVVEMARDCGGIPYAFDSSMIWTDLEPIAEKEGWYAWGKENNIEIIDLHDMPVIPFDFGNESVIRVDKASRLLQESNVLIDIAKMKTHLLTTVTLGLKNNYGNLPRADKGVYHALDIDTVIADVNKAFPTTLAIIDGTNAGEGESGPLTPDQIPDYNTVFASNDVACADAVATKFMGFENPMDIRHIRLATLRGVGNGNCTEDKDVKEEMESAFGSHPKDGRFVVPDPRVIESTSDFMKAIARNRGGASTLSNLADLGLGNLSYYFTGLMHDMLQFFTRLSARYIGTDNSIEWNVNGLNLHPEDYKDSYL